MTESERVESYVAVSWEVLDAVICRSHNGDLGVSARVQFLLL